MGGIERATAPSLDVLELLVKAHAEDVELHEWDIMHRTRLSGPTVYRILDRSEDAQWVTARWEKENPDPSKPRRRFYALSPEGLASARTLFAEHRPKPTGDPLETLRPGTVFSRLAWRLGHGGGCA